MIIYKVDLIVDSIKDTNKFIIHTFEEVYRDDSTIMIKHIKFGTEKIMSIEDFRNGNYTANESTIPTICKKLLTKVAINYEEEIKELYKTIVEYEEIKTKYLKLSLEVDKLPIIRV